MEQLDAQFEQLRPLEGAEAEARAVAGVVARTLQTRAQDIVTLIGPDATIGRLYAAAARPTYLHIGAHGFAVSGRLVNESALALSSADGKSSHARLRLTDLIHTWPGRLAGTKVVTLSACQTATGRLEGRDGVIALLWGFLSAGAETVVATRWSVDDRATALLMERFYRNLLGDVATERTVRGRVVKPAEQMSRLDALYEAQLWLRSLKAEEAQVELDRLLGPKPEAAPLSGYPFARPFYWAAFELVGSPD